MVSQWKHLMWPSMSRICAPVGQLCIELKHINAGPEVELETDTSLTSQNPESASQRTHFQESPTFLGKAGGVQPQVLPSSPGKRGQSVKTGS